MPEVSSSEIEEALRSALGSYGLDHVELESGLDHDGEAALFVTAVLPQHAGPVPMPGDISASANVALAQAMRRVGDERLSYLYIRRPDDERPEEEESRASSP
jgi:3-dehydroquinate synthase class II